MTSLVEENGTNSMDNLPDGPVGAGGGGGGGNNGQTNAVGQPTGLASTIVQILPSQTSSHQVN